MKAVEVDPIQHAKESDLVKAFNQWLSDWQRDPDGFQKLEDEVYVHTGNLETASYGQRSVATLRRYLEKLGYVNE